MLSQLLEKDLILFKWWSLWNTRQHEWCTLLERLETSLSEAQQNAITAEASSDLSDLKAEIQQLRDRMEKQKVALEQEITSLFDFEDSIEIVLE
jgi:ABC-type transporter MlaC component